MKKVSYIVIIVILGIPAIFLAGFLYIGSQMWKVSWVKVDSIAGPDGYTYCLMGESGLTLDPKTKLVRTKEPEDEDTYEELGIVNEESNRLTVIRPVDIVEGPKRQLLLSSNQFVFIARAKHPPFIYDIAANQFYESYRNNEMSPFILIEGEDTELYTPDIIPVILRVVQRYEQYADHKEYLAPNVSDSDIPKEYLPNWPTPEVLKAGLTHPNKEVRKIAGWFSEINENGSSRDSQPACDMIDFLLDNFNTADSYAKYEIVSALGCFRNSYILKMIPLLEKTVMSRQDPLDVAAAASLGKIGKPAFPFLLECLKSEDPAMRRLGLTGFSSSKEEALVHADAIRKLLDDSDAAVREDAASTLGIIEMFRGLREYVESEKEQAQQAV